MPKNCKCVPPFMCKLMFLFWFFMAVMTGYFAYTIPAVLTYVAFLLSVMGVIAVVWVMRR